VKQALSENLAALDHSCLRHLQAIPCVNNILPLSQEDLKQMGTGAIQIPSNSSIVVSLPSDGKYLKYSPANIARWFPKSDVVVKEEAMRIYGALPFVVYPAVPRITKHLAGEIKVVYVERVSKALETLHVEDERAHLDVRFENICYYEGSVKFIDFDRSMQANFKAGSMYNIYHSEMYRVGSTDWTASQLDWKQFGILIGDLVCNPDHRFDRENPLGAGWIQGRLRALMTCLITKGTWNQELFTAWAQEGASQLPATMED
jgi:hypothetical protein